MSDSFSIFAYEMTAPLSETYSADTAATLCGNKPDEHEFKWYVVRSRPHQERKLADLLNKHKDKAGNILEVYCPTHTTVGVSGRDKDMRLPLFAGFVFVLSTLQAVSDAIRTHYPEGTILYDRRNGQGQKACCLTIPEAQMRSFMNFNDNYADRVIILERPYTDYAFNPKTNEPNEIVKVIDGPLKGREGYLVRFRRDKRIVFNMKSLYSDRHFTVSIPNAWSLHVVRMHNAENANQANATLKGRAADLLIGIIENCGYGNRTLLMLYEITEYLSTATTLTGLCRHLHGRGHEKLSRRIARLGTKDAELILNIIRYEADNHGYVRANWRKHVIRPFLTSTSGFESEIGEERLQHDNFTEIIRKTDITEATYYPSKGKGTLTTSTYYAHVGMITRRLNDDGPNGVTIFANWDAFLNEYFLTAGPANEQLAKGTTTTAPAEESANKPKAKLIESFRNFAPTLYNILTDEDSEVKIIKNLPVGEHTLNVIAVTTTGTDADETDKAKDKLIDTCADICKEINSTPHLAVWRRYLMTVWLHE